MKTTFIIEKVGNMIMAVTKFDDGSTDVIWQTWSEESFTERKLNNFMKKQLRYHNGNAEFIKTF